MLTAKTDTVDVVLGWSRAPMTTWLPFAEGTAARSASTTAGGEFHGTIAIGPPHNQIGSTFLPTPSPERRRSVTPAEFDLLIVLARKPASHAEVPPSRSGYRHSADTRLVNVHVQRLRAKIEADPERPEIILTVRGVGYKAGTG